jgi:dienelactone hydrolase
MGRAAGIVSSVAALFFLLGYAELGRLEAGGPRHGDVWLPNDVPATLYLPGSGSDFGAFRDAPAAGERPPGVVLVHGYAGDRVGMSVLARKLADASHAVLAIDVRGHGENRNPYTRSHADASSLYAEMAAAVDFLRASPHADGMRIAVMGHSMGAGAALDYGTRDSGIDAVVLIDGGWSLFGPFPPPNALFVYGEHTERMGARARELAARLVGVDRIEVGKTYGDVSRHTGVRTFEVPGANHASLMWDETASAEIIAWLDAVFGRSRESGATFRDPRASRLPWIYLAALLALPGFGLCVGRIAPRAPEPGPEGRARGLGALALALVLAMPLLSLGAPAAGFVPLETADLLASLFALAGVALLVLLSARGELALGPLLRAMPAALPAAVVAMIGVQILLSPLAVVLHRLPLTPERTLVFLITTLVLFPFSLAVQLLLRRGPPLSAALFALAGRALVLIVLVMGIWLGVVTSVFAFIIGPLFGILLLVEILAASVYASSRNTTAIA